MSLDLPTIWAGIIAFAVLAYVILDGFDLGVGMLFAVFRDKADRDIMTNSIAPVWDGNETWLVLGGGALMAVFPVAYATVMPALYGPLIAMLLGLVFRGVAFEFRLRTRRWRPLWNTGFLSGSLVAALAQGIALGALIQGISVSGRAYAGGWWDWLTPFSLTCGVGVVSGYCLLGATWLHMKTTGKLQEQSRICALVAAAVTLTLIAVVSLWTPFINRVYFERWFGWPTAFFSALVPLLLAICALVLWHGLTHTKYLQPFLAALGLFGLSYAGIGISFYPYIVPGAFTFQQAAGPDKSLAFLLVGAVILVPCILAYTGYAYWIFRGKVAPAGHYH